MSYYGGGQNGSGRSGPGGQQAALLTGPQLYVNSSNQLHLGGGQNYGFGSDGAQNQLQINGGAPLLLQSPVNFVTDQLGPVGLGQLMAGNIMNLGNVLLDQQSGGQQSKQRVFTGTVTKIHDNFGFIDEEVFFQMTVVKGPILPKEGDRVLVEADFNPSMPFKWNATRVQIVNMGGGGVSSASSQAQSYYSTSKPVPPPPSISSGRNQSINSHSIYGQGSSMSSSILSARRGQLYEDFTTGLMPVAKGDRDRKEKERILRDRSRSRDRERERRERERSKRRSRSRSKSRERRRETRRSITPPRRRSRERVRERDRSSERSPSNRAAHRTVERIKRSRSRDTVKSSEGARGSLRDVRSRSSSPKRASKAIAPKSTTRYVVDPPRFSLNTMELNSFDLKSRYKNLYIPSDFCMAKSCWMESFPLDKPFQFGMKPSLVHIMGRRVEKIEIDEGDMESQERFNQVPDVFHAPDASCMFSVKVMLISAPGLDDIYRKSGFTLDTDKKEIEKEELNSYQSLSRIISFVVGIKSGKHDIMALGGNWSSSLDGANPQSDPKVLINTAIRCTKALASIDLTRCKNWYRFMEIYYRRSNGNLETVVYFIPDLSSALPSRSEWETISKTYKLALYGLEGIAAAVEKRKPSKDPTSPSWEPDEIKEVEVITGGAAEIIDAVKPKDTNPECSQPSAATGTDIQKEVVDECNKEADDDVILLEADTEQQEDGIALQKLKDSVLDKSFDIYDDIVENTSAKTMEVVTESTSELVVKLEQENYLDNVKTMNVAKLREELALRNLNTKGLKAQLVSRLQEAIETEHQSKVSSNSTSDDKIQVKNETDEPVFNNVKEEAEDETAVLQLVDPSTLMETSINEESDTLQNATENNESQQTQQPDSKLIDEIVPEKKLNLRSFRGELSYPVIQQDMKPEEKKVWERRFALPKNPRILVFPSTQASFGGKSGSFDCTLLPLSSLKDYRHIDKKEESFEVSLFSELFYEMMQRDFGFKIYVEILKQYKKIKNSDKEKDNDSKSQDETKDSTSSGEPATKRRKASSVVEVRDNMKTIDPFLLLAFTFFDENRYGHISEEHLEDVCAALGLGLTRHEIQKLIRKVGTKGTVYYRKWTDKSELELEETRSQEDDESLLAENDDVGFIDTVLKENKNLLPIFTYPSSVVQILGGDIVVKQNLDAPDREAVTVQMDGETVDVRNVKNELQLAQKERLSAEATVNVLKIALTEAKNQVSELKKSNETLVEDLKKAKETNKKLEASEKSNKDDLEVFKKASERFVDRVKDLIKLPTEKKESSKDKDSSKSEKGQDIVLLDNSKEKK